MKYQLLGKTGIKVSELSLGTMTFGEGWPMGVDKNESKKVYDAFINAGGNFIDTANIYNKHNAESFLGDFTKSERDNIVISTKYTLSENPLLNRTGNSRKNMVESVEESLKRMNTDYIDLYYIHAWDFTVDEEQTMKNLQHLVQSGKVLHIGISDTPAWIVAKSNAIAEIRGWESFAAYQIEYGLHMRDPEREMIPMADNFGMMVCAWSPLGAGLLTGKYLDKENTDRKRMKHGTSARLNEKNLLLSAKVNELAHKVGCTPAQLSLNWVRSKGTKMNTLFGARTASQCIENLKCLEFEIDQDILKELDEISAIEMGFPHDFLKTERVEQIIYGNQKSDIIF